MSASRRCSDAGAGRRARAQRYAAFFQQLAAALGCASASGWLAGCGLRAVLWARGSKLRGRRDCPGDQWHVSLPVSACLCAALRCAKRLVSRGGRQKAKCNSISVVPLLLRLQSVVCCGRGGRCADDTTSNRRLCPLLHCARRRRTRLAGDAGPRLVPGWLPPSPATTRAPEANCPGRRKEHPPRGWRTTKVTTTASIAVVVAAPPLFPCVQPSRPSR